MVALPRLCLVYWKRTSVAGGTVSNEQSTHRLPCRWVGKEGDRELTVVEGRFWVFWNQTWHWSRLAPCNIPTLFQPGLLASLGAIFKYFLVALDGFTHCILRRLAFLEAHSRGTGNSFFLLRGWSHGLPGLAESCPIPFTYPKDGDIALSP